MTGPPGRGQILAAADGGDAVPPRDSESVQECGSSEVERVIVRDGHNVQPGCPACCRKCGRRSAKVELLVWNGRATSRDGALEIRSRHVCITQDATRWLPGVCGASRRDGLCDPTAECHVADGGNP